MPPFSSWHHFLDVKGRGEEDKVHCELVFAEVTEAFVVHVVFYLPEYSLLLYGALGAVFESPIRGEPVLCLQLVSISQWLTSISLLPYRFL